MAIQFLSGLDVDGNITLENSAQLKSARIDNLSSDPTGSDGRIYFNTSTNKLRLYNGSAWVDLSTGADDDTTYDLSGVGSTNGTAGVRLAGSDGTNDDVLIVGSGTTTVTRSGNTLTVTSNDSTSGTVTSVSGGTGITITGSASVTPTVNIDTVGTNNAIEVLTAATPASDGSDYVWFSDVSDSNTLRKALVSDMPGFGKDGTVTSVGSGAGLTGGTITASGTLAVDYQGADNVVLAAADGTSVTLADADDFLFSDATDSNAKYANLSQLATYINAGAGSVTSVGVSGGSTGMSFSNSPITTSGTMTMSGTLDVDNGGTGFSSYTVGDILYADGTASLTKLAIGSAGQVLKVSSGVPSWQNDNNSGGTVTSITLGADSGSGSAITTSGTFTFSGGTNVTTSVSGTTVTINSTDQYQGTVTSVATGAGLTGGTITGSGTISVDYGASGLVADAPGGTGNPHADDYLLVGKDSSGSGETRVYAIVDIPLNILGVPTASLSIGGQKLTSVATGTASTDGVNLGQVQSLVAGVGVFQGGYNASTNSPAIAGSSNIALTTGDFFVVTTDGTISFNGSTVDVEVGDMIYANNNISASSNPAASNYSIVIQDQNIAGAGSTDGGTEKGVAGFNSATFSATANGWISVKAGGISDAQLAETYNQIIGTDSDINTSGVDVIDQLNMTDGVIQSHSTRTLPDSTTGARGVTEIATQSEVDTGTDTFRYVTPATLKAHWDKQSYSATGPASATNSFTITASTHGLGTGPFIIQVYEDSKGVQVFTDVEIASNGDVAFNWTNNVSAANFLRFNIMKVR